MISLSYCGTTTSMREAARDSGMEVVGAMRTDSSHRKNVKRCAVLVSGHSLVFILLFVEIRVNNRTTEKYLNCNDYGKPEYS